MLHTESPLGTRCTFLAAQERQQASVEGQIPLINHG